MSELREQAKQHILERIRSEFDASRILQLAQAYEALCTAEAMRGAAE